MSVRSIMVAALALTIAPQAAAAEPSGKERSTKAPAREDVRVMNAFARCVADTREKDARKTLALDYRTAEYDAALRNLAMRTLTCAPPGKLRFNGVLLAGGIAERLVLRDGLDKNAAVNVKVDPSNPIVARDETEMMILCTASKAPREVAALLRSDPMTSEESTAIEAVLPHLAPCVKSGATARMNRPAMRSLLALAFYRLSQHNLAASQPSGS